MLRTTFAASALATVLTLASCASPTPDASSAHSGLLAADSLARLRADSVARARQDSTNRAQPGYIVDSIRPLAEEVRRFKTVVGGTPATALEGGAPSRDELVARFAGAIAAHDSVGLWQLALTPREFIDLVYPSSPFSKAPYRQPPGLLWSQIQMPSRTGYRRLLERFAGRPLRVDDLRCPRPVETQGENRLHPGCVVRFAAGSAPPRDGTLFGTIIERHGRFKFVSFANMY